MTRVASRIAAIPNDDLRIADKYTGWRSALAPERAARRRLACSLVLRQAQDDPEQRRRVAVARSRRNAAADDPALNVAKHFCQLLTLATRLMIIMWRARHVAAVAGVSTVLGVAGVPLFAQSNSGVRATRALDRTAVGIAREYVAAESVEHLPAALPRNLLVPSVYRALVEAMLRQSATFARQCQRIESASQLTVTLELGHHHTSSAARARTRIVREAGRLKATVVIVQATHLVELIAHEIEHIIEQLDDIDLASKAAVPHSGVQTLDTNGPVFETVRARVIGLRVADEVRRAVEARRSLIW
jgi:hypothetical protein